MRKPVSITWESKRKALDWLVNSGKKYKKPFQDGEFAVLSILGSESWTDYAQVILQIMIADSLLAIEQKLDQLLSKIS